MQLNWLYYCGICQLIPLKLWPNTAQGCIHQSTCMPQFQPLCSAALVPMYYLGGMKARVSPVQWSKPYSILAPTQDLNPCGRIQNHKRWPLHYHCTLNCVSSHSLNVMFEWFIWNKMEYILQFKKFLWKNLIMQIMQLPCIHCICIQILHYFRCRRNCYNRTAAWIEAIRGGHMGRRLLQILLTICRYNLLIHT